ncbi:hypothetical protein K402DRAFT_325196 [Aulographum hederae CBS 113979]|uniref:ML-like domain-containing protein n=1 Tax=Aulographum hederae CBS 113979 TaxID=1176131 RepID=A0A6G1HBN3_9PEZI|nr:hypothetical protein K402DRAFT_325196 [Aulographum hederae CBS 113979]
MSASVASTLRSSLEWRSDSQALYRQECGRRSSLQLCKLRKLLLLSLTALIPSPARAAFVNFGNCLDSSVVNSSPVLLQFTPLIFDAKFSGQGDAHNLSITIYGNVSGQTSTDPLPPWNSSEWSDDSRTNGKITDRYRLGDATGNYTTLFPSAGVLTYTPWPEQAERFCNFTTGNTECPISPAFNGSASDPSTLPAFTVEHVFDSSYAFSTFATRFRVVSGDQKVSSLACISANITPDLGSRIANALAFLPAAILAMVAISTLFAARFSPWSSVDYFSWTSNFGRDEDLLRLVTPGFGDCLQYIQFIVLAGSLSLSYPGYYQPVVSQASWSVLMYNESFVSHGNGLQNPIDGIYATNGTYGLTRTSQLDGMNSDTDVWAGMAIWLCILTACVIFLCQMGFFGRWIYRAVSNVRDGDLQSKNLPFTVGNIVRIVYNYFLLPIVTLTMFQLVIAPRSPGSVVGGAVVMLVLLLAFAAWIFRCILTTKPRIQLFDDLPTLLLYGPLYNTYSDEAAPFAFIPVLLTFVRGIAIGAVQPSGIAQLVILAICEVVMILTLNAFRPFQGSTSMNAYHTFFAVVRLVTTLLSIAFVPSLDINEASKGWLGYVILLLHGIVLVFGFFLNSIQTIIEVSARLAGAGRDARGGLTKVFGMRQLRQRGQRDSLRSNQAILANDADAKSVQLHEGRSRSVSASSAILLNQQSPRDRRSTGFDDASFGEGSSAGAGTGAQSPFSYLPGSTSAAQSRRQTLTGGKVLEPTDPYYRPPRRRLTLDPVEALSPTSEHAGDVEMTNQEHRRISVVPTDPGEGPSNYAGHRDSIISPGYVRNQAEGSDPNLSEQRRKNTDYTTRESDFYYGVRGPALSSLPSRKLKTGPADPMGPVSSVGGWFKSFLGGKSKDRGKGFEVVRSIPAPLAMDRFDEEQGELSPPIRPERYQDSPTSVQSPQLSSDNRVRDDVDRELDSDDDPFDARMHPGFDGGEAPALAPMDFGGSLHMPSRAVSKASTAVPKGRGGMDSEPVPNIPRRSSRRTPSADLDMTQGPRLSPIPPSPGLSPPIANARTGRSLSSRLPFGSDPSPDRSPGHSGAENSRTSSIYESNSASHSEAGLDSHLQPPPNMSGGQRPVSTGHVGRHLAGDSIHPQWLDDNQYLGSAAEFVEESSRKTSPAGNPGRNSSGGGDWI